MGQHSRRQQRSDQSARAPAEVEESERRGAARPERAPHMHGNRGHGRTYADSKQQEHRVKKRSSSGGYSQRRARQGEKSQRKRSRVARSAQQRPQRRTRKITEQQSPA